MNRDMAMVLAIAAAVAVCPGAVLSEQLESPVSPEAFLKKAAQGQQAEIALGQLASKKATDPQVKQFGAHMIEDHQKASQEVQQLASREGIQLPSQMSEKHKQKQQQFSQLSGKEFDRAYMMYMLRNHMIDVTEFEQQAPAIKDPQVQQWAAGALPILKQHLQQAQQIATEMGLQTTHAR